MFVPRPNAPECLGCGHLEAEHPIRPIVWDVPPAMPRPPSDYVMHPVLENNKGRHVYAWVVADRHVAPLASCYKCDYPEHEGVSCRRAKIIAKVLIAMRIIRRRVI